MFRVRAVRCSGLIFLPKGLRTCGQGAMYECNMKYQHGISDHSFVSKDIRSFCVPAGAILQSSVFKGRRISPRMRSRLF